VNLPAVTAASQEQGQEMRLKSALCEAEACQRRVFSAYFGFESVGLAGAAGAAGAGGVAGTGVAAIG